MHHYNLENVIAMALVPFRNSVYYNYTECHNFYNIHEVTASSIDNLANNYNIAVHLELKLTESIGHQFCY